MAGKSQARLHDLGHVELIRRAAVVREYLRIDKPAVKDAEQAAAKLGIGKRNFYYLVSAAREGRTERISRPKISSAVEKVISDAIQMCGSNAPIDRIGQAARMIARDRSLPEPANKTVAARVRKSRVSNPRSVASRFIVLDQGPLTIIAEAQGKRFVPFATVAIRLDTHQVIGLAISDAPGVAPFERAFAEAAVRRGQESSSSRIEIVCANIDRNDDRARFEAALAGANIDLRDEQQLRLPLSNGISRILDGQIAGIPIHPRLKLEEIAARAAREAPVPVNDIEAYIRERLDLPTLNPWPTLTGALTEMTATTG